MQIKDLGSEERVVLTGRMAHGKIPQFISASDVCVAPFTREVNENIDLSPMKLFEYLAVARPVVASDIGGLDRYAENIPSLYLVKIEDDEAFALKIIELLENPNEEKSNIGADVIRNQYTWQQAATKILEYMDL
jgi:glycosyltransferase involved in cell wall biosynthesis